MGKTLSISFRNDELDRIDELMKDYGMNRHEVIKLAVRRFLFPHEKTVPLGEKKLKCAIESQREQESSEKPNRDYDVFEDDPIEDSPRVQEPPFLGKDEDNDEFPFGER